MVYFYHNDPKMEIKNTFAFDSVQTSRQTSRPCPLKFTVGGIFPSVFCFINLPTVN